MARGVARGIRGGQGRRTISARNGNNANRIARKRSLARGSQRQAERLYRQNRADQRTNRLLQKGVDTRRGRVSNPVDGNLNAATGFPARQTDRVLVTPAPGDRRRGGGLNAIRNARNVRPGGGGQGRRTIGAGNGSANQLQRILQGRRNFDGTPTGGNAGGGGGIRTGNAGGGSTSGDPNKSRGSRRAASATAPTPAVRPRPSEARAARGQLIRQISNRTQNARRSQRTI
jgi:hypothetical protein